MSKLEQKQTEKEICKAFYKQYKQLQQYNFFKKNILLFHIANEQFNNRLYTISLIAMGMLPGVADYCVLVEGGKVAFIEFKHPDRIKQLSENQKWFKAQCRKLKIPYTVQCSIVDALLFIADL